MKKVKDTKMTLAFMQDIFTSKRCDTSRKKKEKVAIKVEATHWAR